ncbi:Hypothetical predicted protein [Pelobates cultripes]|uniref:Uncharacterized protein n=1 Tax=Pelobates cultripes TaxID=61616 RepID=A0AAD1WA48_PELCU|nr:Hypothetical predicted protein [Pelobates cultripes]
MWFQILNKCALDLIALRIEGINEELDKITTQKVEITALLTARIEVKNFQRLTQEITVSISTLNKELESIKIHTFKRDTLDYQYDRVYTWKQQTQQKITRKPVQQSSSRETLSVGRSFLGGSAPTRCGNRGTSSYKKRQAGNTQGSNEERVKRQGSSEGQQQQQDNDPAVDAFGFSGSQEFQQHDVMTHNIKYDVIMHDVMPVAYWEMQQNVHRTPGGQ